MKKAYSIAKVELVMGITIIGMWLLGELLFRLAMPEYYFRLFPLIPVLFLIYSFAVIAMEKRWERKLAAEETTMANVVNIMMVSKVAKLVLSAVLILCYIQFVDVQIISFTISFMIFYMVFIILESFAVYQFQERFKAGMKKN